MVVPLETEARHGNDAVPDLLLAEAMLTCDLVGRGTADL
jgi:hypothetical protein